MDILLPPTGTGPGAIVAHPWWGLNQTIRDYGAALAAEGFVVGLPDLFDGNIATTIEGAQKLSETEWTPDAEVRLRAAITELAAHRAVTGGKVGAVGFSYSGFPLYGLSGDAALPLNRVVIYYATGRFQAPHAPILAHFAESDPFESDEYVAAVTAGLVEDGPPNVAYRYEGTTHWFAEADRPEYVAGAARLAFQRSVEFLRGA